jgi:hypothetical protein
MSIEALTALLDSLEEAHGAALAADQMDIEGVLEDAYNEVQLSISSFTEGDS